MWTYLCLMAGAKRTKMILQAAAYYYHAWSWTKANSKQSVTGTINFYSKERDKGVHSGSKKLKKLYRQEKTKTTRPRLCMILSRMQSSAHCGKCSDWQMNGQLFMNIKLLHASVSVHKFKQLGQNVSIFVVYIEYIISSWQKFQFKQLRAFLGIKWHSWIIHLDWFQFILSILIPES